METVVINTKQKCDKNGNLFFFEEKKKRPKQCYLIYISNKYDTRKAKYEWIKHTNLWTMREMMIKAYEIKKESDSEKENEIKGGREWETQPITTK